MAYFSQQRPEMDKDFPLSPFAFQISPQTAMAGNVPRAYEPAEQVYLKRRRRGSVGTLL